MGNSIKLGVALGGGGARGLAHIGVLKVLESKNIPVGMIVGTSIGALVGAAYATHPDAEELKQWVLEVLGSKGDDARVLNLSAEYNGMKVTKTIGLIGFIALHRKRFFYI